MRALFSSLETVILAQAAAERERLQRYFAEIEFIPAPRVEVRGGRPGLAGFFGACACKRFSTCVHRTTGHEHCALRAFYFGTWHFARTALEAGCDLSSFFFHLDKPAPRRALVSEAVELIELFFGAPHPTIVGLREGADGRIEPVVRIARTRGRAAAGRHPDAGARGRFRSRRGRPRRRSGELLDWPGTGLGYLEAVLERLLRRPSLEEARTLGALPARDSFGGSSPEPPHRPATGEDGTAGCIPRVYAEAYQHAFWKRGFLAQLSPREAARAQAAR